MDADKVLKFILLSLIALVVGAILLSYVNCAKVGGTLVRGVFYYECVNHGE